LDIWHDLGAIYSADILTGVSEAILYLIYGRHARYTQTELTGADIGCGLEISQN
jgi:hypothetical protein